MSILSEPIIHTQRTNLLRAFRALLLLWENPLWSLILALVIYGALATYNGSAWSSSEVPYYNYLADSFLHGQLDLRVMPPSTHDLVHFDHKYYLYWPPMPAILLMPFVALFGIGFSDVFFTLCIAALNVSLVALLLRQVKRRGLVNISVLQRAILVLFFALGTVHITLAPFGRVWFTGQLVGFMFVALAYLAATSHRGWLAFFLTGVCMACAMLTRNHLLFVGIWPAVYLLVRHKGYGFRKLLAAAVIGALPILAGLGLMFLYNWARFGNFLEVGLDYHQMGELFVGAYQQYGAFHPYYLSTNFFYQYIAYPFPIRPDSLMGGSLFLLSPVFFLVFYGIKSGRPRWMIWTLLAAILVVNIPILMLMGTGWVQFGPRYTLDFTIPLLLLTAYGAKSWTNLKLGLLTAVSVIHYFIGTLFLSIIF